MAKTLKDMMTAEPSAIADAVAASAQQIWQAGLGAFAKAQQDGGEMFDALVRDGAALHQLTQKFVGARLPGMTGTVGRLAESVGRQASGSLDKIEKLFDDRVARSLNNLGAPSRDEVDALRREIDALKATLARPAPARAAKTASTTARKAATKDANKAAAQAAPRASAARPPAKSAAAASKRAAKASGARA